LSSIAWKLSVAVVRAMGRRRDGGRVLDAGWDCLRSSQG
jgi:hypothetical protein